MKKYIYSLMALAAIACFASCSSEDNEAVENDGGKKKMIFTVTQENRTPATKAELAEDGTSIYWEAGDKISIFDGTNNNEFTLIEGAGTTYATFEGTAKSATFYTALYPYQAGVTFSDGKAYGVTLPATQTAVANGFDKSAALMIEMAATTKLTLFNAVGYVKVTPKFDCKRIELKAFDNSAILAGTGDLTFNMGRPAFDFSASETKDYAITLEGTITAGNAYYIAVPAVTLKAGWVIRFTTTDDQVFSRKGTKDIKFTYNMVTDLGEFSTDGTYWYDPRGKVDESQEVDMGLTITMGSKRYKVIFAKTNLTGTALAEKASDFGDFFAWGATEPWCTGYTREGTGSSVTITNPVWNNSKGHTTYDWSSIPFRDGTNNYCSKYTSKGLSLEMADDAANQILGGDWQIPTVEVWEGLFNRDNYTWTASTQDGYNGILVENPSTGATLFFPASGGITGNRWFFDTGKWGYCQTSRAGSNIHAYGLNFTYYGSVDPSTAMGTRHNGYPVRPVRLISVE